MNYLDALRQRYAVKKFDSSRKVPSDKLQNILAAGHLSASSSGLQPYEVIVVQSADFLERLQPAFFNPSQVSTCSALLVITVRKELDAGYLDNYFRHISQTRGVPEVDLEGFRRSVENYKAKKSPEELLHWNEKQAYLLLGTMLAAAAMEGVDSCPMEGFRHKKISEILGIDMDKYSPAVTLALGYRAEDDVYQHVKKVRKPEELMFRFL